MSNGRRRYARPNADEASRFLRSHIAREERVYLRVNYRDRMWAKRNGARWDPSARLWWSDQWSPAAGIFPHTANPYNAPTRTRPSKASAPPTARYRTPIHVDRFGTVLTDTDLRSA